MQQVILTDDTLDGFEYGVLRSFEDAILSMTAAQNTMIPPYRRIGAVVKHFALGMNRGVKYRSYFPKQSLDLPQSDLLWYIIMSPQDYRLDLFKGWQDKSRVKVLYIFDTLPHQYELIRKICSEQHWDYLITSFSDAIADLQRITGRQWHCIEQAGNSVMAQVTPIESRVIDFSSYGRRDPSFHELLKSFCAANKLYYDYSTHNGRSSFVDSREHYQQYNWHLSHSKFTISWPVERTNPARAGHLHPITCRWFESALCGTVILGRKPANRDFDGLFPASLVIDVPEKMDKATIFKWLDEVYASREHLLYTLHHDLASSTRSFDWNDRVRRILNLILKPTEAR